MSSAKKYNLHTISQPQHSCTACVSAYLLLFPCCVCVCVLLSFCIGSFVVCISEDGLSVKWINVLVVGIRLHYSACHVSRHYF